MVPNEFAFAQQHIGPRLRIVGDEQQTRENSFKAVNDACVQLRATKDSHWGLLIKPGGANAFGYAADVWLYDLGNGTAQVVDVVGNSEGAPPPEGGPRGTPVVSWGEKDIRQISEWAPPVEPPYESTTPTPPPDTDDTDEQIAALEGRVAQLEGTVDEQGASLAALTEQVASLSSMLAQPLRAHGPVDLPIVVENWDRMRAKGDIDVQVVPGTATPPPSSGDAFNLLDIAILRKLIARLRPGADE